MPSSSERQARTMSAIAHGWKPKGKAKGIPVSVAKEFHAADKGKKYGKGRGHNPGHHGHNENPRHHYGVEGHNHRADNPGFEHPIHGNPGHHDLSHYTKDHHSVHNPTTHNEHKQTHQHHRTPGHSPHVGNNDGFAGKLEQHFTGKRGDGRHGKGGGLAHHAKLPGGHKGKEMVGFAETRHTGGHDSYHGEQVEHYGADAKDGGGVARGHGTNRPHGHRSTGHHVGNPGNTRHHAAEHGQSHSHLAEKAGMGHAKQPHRGDPTGAGRLAVAEHHVGHVMKHEHDSHESVTHEPMTAHVFRNPMGGDSHGYGHSSYERHGFLRHSGHKGAHRIGHRSK